MKICIDPGHGGYDPGAAANGLREKDITLNIALQLKSLLEQNGIDVVLTRTADYAPGHLEGNLIGELRARAAIAKNNKVDLFVSIHINAGGGTGAEVLIPGQGGNAEKAAKMVLPYLIQTGEWANRGVKVQNVLVLRETPMPAILTESGFIDHSSDSAKLKNPAFLKALAIAHAKGICDYFGVPYKEAGGISEPNLNQTPSRSSSTPSENSPTSSQTPSTPSQTPSDPPQTPSTSSGNFSYPNNAKVIGVDLYIRDVNSTRIQGRYVADGENITVLNVSYPKQLVLVEYPTPSGVRNGYVKNITNCIKYYHQDEWANGSTPEPVLNEKGAVIGSLNPREQATPLYRKDGKLHVVYATDQGRNTKSGYVVYNDGFNKF